MQRNPHPSPPARAGFTLIEVLVSLGLCALLASTTAGAIAFASRADRIAARYGDASLLVPALYAAQRLRPDDLPAPPRGWRVEPSADIVRLDDETLRAWHQLAVAADGREIPAFILRILDDTP